MTMEKEDLYAKIIEWLSNLGSVVAEEMPTFVREVAQYGFYENVILSSCMFILSIVLIGLFVFVFRINNEISKEDKNDDLSFLWVVMFVLFCLSGGCLWVVVNNTCEAIKSKVAPRLYVMERFIKK